MNSSSITSVVIVTHGRAGADMLEAAQAVLQTKFLQVTAVGINVEDECDIVQEKIEQALRSLNVETDEDVLFLVDLLGSTPARMCYKKYSTKGHVVTGMNMPMLLKLATADRNRGPADLGKDLAMTGAKSIHCE